MNMPQSYLNKPLIFAKRITQPLMIDGKLREEYRGKAYLFSDFKTGYGKKISQKTTVYFSYDENNLYISFNCKEKEIDKLTLNNTNKHRKIILQPRTNDDDYVEIFLDSKHNHMEYFHFLVNPAGDTFTAKGIASRDKLFSDPEWSPKKWRAKTYIGKDFWNVNMQTPFSEIGISGEKDGLILGINIIRERTPIERETSFLVSNSLSWTTQWTSSIVFEPSTFAHLILDPFADSVIEKTSFRPSRRWEIKRVSGKNFWMIHPPIWNLPGIDKHPFIGDSDLIATRYSARIGAYRVVIREIEVYEVGDSGNIANQAKISGIKGTEGLKCINDGKYDESAVYNRWRPYPTEGWFGLDFGEERKIEKVVLYHGIKLAKDINSNYVEYTDIADSFVVQFWDNNKWHNIPGAEVRGNKEDKTIHNFKPISTSRIRVYIFSQRYTGNDYPDEESWKWWFEDTSLNERGNEFLKLLRVAPDEQKLRIAPFCLRFRRYCYGDFLKNKLKNEPIIKKAYENLIKKFGKKFLGFSIDEWDSDVWGVVVGMSEDEAWDKHPKERPGLPKDKIESEKILKKEFTKQKKILWDNCYTMNCWRCVDHYALEWGANHNQIEITGNGNPSHQIQIAFARGAARQYDKFWSVYIAMCLGTAVTDYITPGLLNDYGAEWLNTGNSGPSESLYRRMIFNSYLSGATIIDFEYAQNAHIQFGKNKDTFRISSHGEPVVELLNYVRNYPERGIPYTPCGILIDYYHGWSPPYQTGFAYGRSGLQTWFNIPYTNGDHMLYQFMYTLFPWTRQRIEREGSVLTNAPYGDIFDVLVANPPSGTLDDGLLGSYKVLFLVGDIKLDSGLVKRLMKYVENGGTLVLNSIYFKYFPGKFLKIQQESNPIFVDEEGKPFVTKIHYGDGNVVLTIPEYLIDKDNKALPFLSHLLRIMLKDVLPFKIFGSIQYLVSREKDKWILTLINNKGIYKIPHKPPVVKDEEASDVMILFKNDIISCIERLSGNKIEIEQEIGGNYFRVNIPPGDIKILEVKTLNS